MKPFALLLGGLLLAPLAGTAWAERPPQTREQARLVVSGTIRSIATKESRFVDDGVRTDFRAQVEVDVVDRGEAVKKGDVITVTWYRVTRFPSQPTPGAYGHAYALKENERARFWLLSGLAGEAKKEWEIIYSPGGVERLDQPSR